MWIYASQFVFCIRNITVTQIIHLIIVHIPIGFLILYFHIKLFWSLRHKKFILSIRTICLVIEKLKILCWCYPASIYHGYFLIVRIIVIWQLLFASFSTIFPWVFLIICHYFRHDVNICHLNIICIVFIDNE
jgi:hypothetical protein